MSSNAAAAQVPANNHLDRDGKICLIKGALGFVIQGLIIFLCAGRIDWLRGWIYLGLAFLAQYTILVYLVRKNPQLINLRGRIQAGTKGYDRLLLALFIPLSYAVLAVGGLDGGRFGGPGPGPGALLAGGLMFILGAVLVNWAITVNPHFEATIRIQEDRDHQVCTRGPYRLVRHPGYLGWLLILFSAPLILASWWGLVPAGLAGGLLVVRTALEDRTLRLELAGYLDYSLTTKTRLIPWLW